MTAPLRERLEALKSARAVLIDDCYSAEDGIVIPAIDAALAALAELTGEFESLTLSFQQTQKQLNLLLAEREKDAEREVALRNDLVLATLTALKEQWLEGEPAKFSRNLDAAIATRKKQADAAIKETK